MTVPLILLLPGWQDSGPGHWQTEWERVYGDQRVQQHDWMRPLRGDWSARLEEVVADAPGDVVLAAHSLGCILTAWWAAHTRHAHKVRGALLVAPGDVERPDLSAQLRGWAPIACQALPFRAVLVGSRNDPYCGFERAQALAQDWGARFVDLGNSGHVNAESGLGAWPEGRVLLHSLMNKD